MLNLKVFQVDELGAIAGGKRLGLGALVDTGALCAEIYTPELFTKVRRPIWPLDPIADPRAASA